MSARLQVQLVVDGTQFVEDELQAVADRARNAQPLMQRLLVSMREAEAQAFASSGGSAGAEWKPDESAWVAEKSARGWDPRPERRTGDLEASLTGIKGPHSIQRANKQSAALGTRILYAGFQGERPLLRFFGLRTEWEGMVMDWLTTGET